MKLVIDIPKDVVTAIQNGEDYRYDIHTAIAQGTPYEERPKGEWLHENDDHYDWYVCSHCGYGDEGEVTDTLSAYCPCCGAEMRSVDEGLHARAISDLSKAVDDAYKKARGAKPTRGDVCEPL